MKSPSFFFQGEVPPSKSEAIRALILGSWKPGSLQPEFTSPILGNDVLNILNAVKDFKNQKKEFYIGASGLGLRLLAIRVSRVPGEYVISGEPRLFERPSRELKDLLLALGVRSEWKENCIHIFSQGWIWKNPIEVSLERSSQFATALFLNSWFLPDRISVRLRGNSSRSYFQLTLNMLKEAGLIWRQSGAEEFEIEAHQAPTNLQQKINCQPDMSTAFTIAAWGILGGQSILKNFPLQSSQPDFEFLNLFKAMGVKFYFSEGKILFPQIEEPLLPVKWEMSQTPDLWPVACVLCALAKGESVLTGLTNQRWKESDRIKKGLELLNLLGRDYEIFNQGSSLRIWGRGIDDQDRAKNIKFDADQDHRWVMAGHAAILAGFKNLTIDGLQAIAKTAPQLEKFVSATKINAKIFIGHRGTGKSSLARRLVSKGIITKLLDLDSEIEKRTSSSIDEIFRNHGEIFFRNLEIETLKESLSEGQYDGIVLGAGFKLEELKNITALFESAYNFEIIWVRRKTDASPRIFFDRPLLNAGLDPSSDYSSLFPAREAAYLGLSQLIYTMPEGQEWSPKGQEDELRFFKNEISVSPASITVLPQNMTDKKTFLNWLKKRQNWGVQYFELRTDLLAPQMLQWAQDLIPKEKILLSLRGRLNESESQMLMAFKFSALDIPLEELRNPTENSNEIFLKLFSHCERQRTTLILSFHKGNLMDLKAILPKVSERAIIKFSPAILTFRELKEAHDWAMENPNERAFLPRGMGWHWYRLWTKSKFALTFVREGDGPPQGEDQPTIMQWLGTTNYSETPTFSAVLGYPLAHSYSPAIHGDEGAFFDIQIHPDDKFEEALEVLKSLGLRKAAVTSPYKGHAARILGEEFVSVNTLVYSEALKSWRGTNTDFPALKDELLELLKYSGSEPLDSKDIQNKICIWGGGGTLAPLRKLLPHAISYSAQRGEPRSEDTGIETAGIETAGIEKGDQFSPAIIIWAARSGSNVKRPPSTWSPQLVFDLNYVESSLGREIARNYGARYISGLNMFRLQAKLQKEFWMSQENDKTSRGESL